MASIHDVVYSELTAEYMFVWSVVNDAELFSPSYRPWWILTETKPVLSETTFHDEKHLLCFI